MRSPITRTLAIRLGAPVPSITRAPTISTPFAAASGVFAEAGLPHAAASASTASEATRADRIMGIWLERNEGTENVARGPALQQTRHPLSDVIADDGHAESDDEHVETRAEDAAPREDRARRANQEVRRHGERERRDHRRG